MTQKNETVPFLVALLLTGGILGGTAWWVFRSPGSPFPFISGAGTASLESRFSSGERILFPAESSNADFNQLKQLGVSQLAAKNPGAAIPLLESALSRDRNAPETLIYLNNARIGTEKSYTIAVPLPITTDLPGSAELLRGVAQAQDQINRAGGVNGTKIKIVIANDDNSPAIAQQIANQWVKDSAVVGVVGHYASDVTLEAGKVYNDGKLVCISPISTTVKLSGFSKYVFRSVPSDYVAGRALADYGLKTLKQRNFAVFFNSQSGYSRSLKEEFATAISLGGGQMSTEFDLSRPDFNAAQAVEQALSQGAKVLMLAPNTGALDKALQVAQANQKRAMLLAGDDAYAPKTLDLGREQAIDMVVGVPWHIDANRGTPFVQESWKLWGAAVNWRSVTAYDAVQAIGAGLQKNPTRDGIQQALTTSDFSATGASQMVRFLPSGDRNSGIQLVKVVADQKSRTGYNFAPILIQQSSAN
jgi:branched-chain amino acid transport system substrate-binding protein